jgi:hypothetical protein
VPMLLLDDMPSADKVVDAAWTRLNNSIACITSDSMLLLSLSGMVIRMSPVSHPTCRSVSKMQLFTSLTGKKASLCPKINVCRGVAS